MTEMTQTNAISLDEANLVVACDRPLKGERGYYLVMPEHAQDPPVLAHFCAWLTETVADDGA